MGLSEQLDDPERALRYALYRLGSQALHSAELRKGMSRKGYVPDVIEQTIQRCLDLGYLDDAEWVQGYVRRKLRNLDGPHKIRAQLVGKGVEYSHAQQAIDRIDAEQLMESLDRLITGKYAKYDQSEPDQRSKLVAALHRKGYDLDMIYEVLRVDRCQ